MNTHLGGLFSDLQEGKHSTRQSWLGSIKYAICQRKEEKSDISPLELKTVDIINPISKHKVEESSQSRIQMQIKPLTLQATSCKWFWKLIQLKWKKRRQKKKRVIQSISLDRSLQLYATWTWKQEQVSHNSCIHEFQKDKANMSQTNCTAAEIASIHFLGAHECTVDYSYN